MGFKDGVINVFISLSSLPHRIIMCLYVKIKNKNKPMFSEYDSEKSFVYYVSIVFYRTFLKYEM